MIKEIVEPMFKTMLPGPLATLHFTKIDLGPVPLRLSEVKTTKTEIDGIKVDLNVDWVGKADIELDADYIPALVSSCLFSTMRMPIIRNTGCGKRGASWQAFHTTMPSHKHHTAGKPVLCHHLRSGH